MTTNTVTIIRGKIYSIST